MLKYLRSLKNEAVFIFFLIITYFIRLETPESSGLENYTTVHTKKNGKISSISRKRDFLGSWDIRLL
jgi:abortive infection bacteriophage resistance protein